MRRDKHIIENLPLVRRVANKIYYYSTIPRPLSLDDLISAGTIGLIQGIDSYDKSRNLKYETWLILNIEWAIFKEIRELSWVGYHLFNRKSGLSKTSFISKGSVISRELIYDSTLLDTLPDDNSYIAYRDITYADLWSIFTRLKPSEVSLLEKFYVAGLSLEEIGKEEGVSRQAISKRIKRIVKKIRKIILEAQDLGMIGVKEDAFY